MHNFTLNLADMMRLIFMLLIIHRTCGVNLSYTQHCSHTEILVRSQAIARANGNETVIEGYCSNGRRVLATSRDPCASDPQFETYDCQSALVYHCDRAPLIVCGE